MRTPRKAKTDQKPLLLGAVVMLVTSLIPASAADAIMPKAFVVNAADGTVSLVDLKQMKELSRFNVGKEPYGIAISQDGTTLIIGVEGEERVKFFDTRDFKLKGELAIGKMFHDHIMLTKDGKNFLIAEYGSDALIAIDPGTMKEAFRVKGLSGPHVTKYGPTQKRVYVTCKKITGIASVNADDPSDVKFWPLNVNPRSLTFSPDESKLYFGSFWVDGVFELDTDTGKITRLFALHPPASNKAPQEVTYHGVEAVGPKTVLTVNEGRSYVDAFDIKTGKLLSRFTDVSKPCCLERVPTSADKVAVLVSSTGDGYVELVQVMPDGKMKLLGKIKVGAGPKRVAFSKD